MVPGRPGVVTLKYAHGRDGIQDMESRDRADETNRELNAQLVFDVKGWDS